MKRTYRFARPVGTAACVLENGEQIELPLVQGVLRHATAAELRGLLGDPVVARKYTAQALKTAAWPVLREFPRAWLVACLGWTELPPGRRRALEYLLRA